MWTDREYLTAFALIFIQCSSPMQAFMNVELLTKDDLQEFRIQLLSDLKSMFQLPSAVPQKAWLRSAEVRKLLQVSPNTLQGLRIAGKLHPTKIGGILYYSREEIDALLSKGAKLSQ